MHFFAIIIAISASAVAATSTGQRSSLMALKGVFERQVQICKPVPEPATCEASCGPGNIPCISLPSCYNPSAGETCCSNGDYCSAGYYCTNGGCCPNGSSLADCGATVSLSVIPPPAASSSASNTRSTSSSAATTSSATTTISSSIASTTSTQLSSTSATKLAISTASSALPTAVGTVPSNSTTTTSLPIQATGNAGQKLDYNIIHVTLGGLGIVLMFL